MAETTPNKTSYKLETVVTLEGSEAYKQKGQTNVADTNVLIDKTAAGAKASVSNLENTLNNLSGATQNLTRVNSELSTSLTRLNEQNDKLIKISTFFQGFSKGTAIFATTIKAVSEDAVKLDNYLGVINTKLGDYGNNLDRYRKITTDLVLKAPSSSMRARLTTDEIRAAEYGFLQSATSPEKMGEGAEKNITGFVEGAATLARGTGMGIKEAADSFATLHRNIGLSYSETEKMAKQLTSLSRAGSLSTESVKQLIDASALLARTQGLGGQTAAEYEKNIFALGVSFQQLGINAQQGLNELNLSRTGSTEGLMQDFILGEGLDDTAKAKRRQEIFQEFKPQIEQLPPGRQNWYLAQLSQVHPAFYGMTIDSMKAQFLGAAKQEATPGSIGPLDLDTARKQIETSAKEDEKAGRGAYKTAQDVDNLVTAVKENILGNTFFKAVQDFKAVQEKFADVMKRFESVLPTPGGTATLLGTLGVSIAGAVTQAVLTGLAVRGLAAGAGGTGTALGGLAAGFGGMALPLVAGGALLAGGTYAAFKYKEKKDLEDFRNLREGSPGQAWNMANKLSDAEFLEYKQAKDKFEKENPGIPFPQIDTPNKVDTTDSRAFKVATPQRKQPTELLEWADKTGAYVTRTNKGAEVGKAHGDNRAIDIRTKDITTEQKQTYIDEFKKAFPTGIIKNEDPSFIYQGEPGKKSKHWTAPHFHFELPPEAIAKAKAATEDPIVAQPKEISDKQANNTLKEIRNANAQQISILQRIAEALDKNSSAFPNDPILRYGSESTNYWGR